MQSRAKYRTMLDMQKPLHTAIASLVIGLLTTVAMTVVPLLRADRGHGAQITQIYRGEWGWYRATDHAFGLDWSNLGLMQTTLTSPLFDGDIPAWAEPPQPPYPKVPYFRVGTLAAGWPLRTVAFRWMVSDPKQRFPIAAEVDDQDTSLGFAAENVLEGSRGGFPHERRILWQGIAVNAAIYAGSAFVTIFVATLLMRVFRSRAGVQSKRTNSLGG